MYNVFGDYEILRFHTLLTSPLDMLSISVDYLEHGAAYNTILLWISYLPMMISQLQIFRWYHLQITNIGKVVQTFIALDCVIISAGT
jgi:hypothetical protein